jgi:uncharacterized protein (UPF0261 family)
LPDEKGVLILATLDTKGPEALYLCDTLRDLGEEPLLMDLSMRYGDQMPRSIISAEEVAEAGGSRLDVLSASREMGTNMDVMVSGATRIARTLVREGKVRGVIGIGGYTGTFMITAVMQALPFGIPKIMVSSAAALPGLSNQFLKTSDIMLFHSVIEISGLSDPVRNVIGRAVHALSGMLHGRITDPVIDKNKAIAMTMLNICEKCAKSVRLALEKEGYQVIGFHAAGIGDRAMEEMIAEGLFRAVIDLAPGGVGEHLYGFMRDAGPHRLEAAGKAGIPQIVSTCGVNHITPSRSMVGLKQGERRTYHLDRFRTWFRMTPDELQEVAKVFAGKLNLASGPVRVLIPLRGWSSIESPGSPTYDPEEDALFVRGLKRTLKKEIEVIEVDGNMEDPEFSSALVGAAFDVLGIRNKLEEG